MIRNYNRQDLKFMKKWKCVSKSFARINLLIIIATAIAFMFCFYCELIPEDEILIYSIFTVILIIECVISYIKQRKLIKYVRFTAEAIYIEKNKIDIKYLQSLSFIKKIYICEHNYLGTIKFRMKFYGHLALYEDVYFYMAFKQKMFDLSDYDYQDRFINVIMRFAQNRKTSNDSSFLFDSTQ